MVDAIDCSLAMEGKFHDFVRQSIAMVLVTTFYCKNIVRGTTCNSNESWYMDPPEV